MGKINSDMDAIKASKLDINKPSELVPPKQKSVFSKI